jgi:hypothetical protein
MLFFLDDVIVDLRSKLAIVLKHKIRFQSVAFLSQSAARQSHRRSTSKDRPRSTSALLIIVEGSEGGRTREQLEEVEKVP